jgi:hypothetical protein
MVRRFFSFVVTCGVGVSVLLHTSPAAAEKSKRWPTTKSDSANSRGMSSSNSSMNGFAAKKFQGITSQSAHVTGGAKSLSSKGLALGKQQTGPLKFTKPLNLSSANGIQNGSGPASDGLVLYTPPDFGPRGNSRPKLPTLDQNKITDALKNSKLQPMQPNFSLDDIVGGAGNGAGNDGDAADQGADGQADLDADDDNPHDATVPIGDPHDPHDDDCDHDHDCPFPWWPPVIIGGGYCPPAAHITVIEQPIVVQTLPASIDLQIVDVRIVDFGDAAHHRGPRYRIVFTNVGTVATGNFQLMAMASNDGTPKPAAPVATAEVVTLAPGELASVDVRLPLTADLSTMGALIVVIDSAVEITETDEQNNVLILDRTEIAIAETVATAKQ